MDDNLQAAMRILLVLLAILSTTTGSFLFVAAASDGSVSDEENLEKTTEDLDHIEHKISHGRAPPHTRRAAATTTFTKDTWAIAATSPLLANKASSSNNPLQRQPVQQQTPYVHWTCFRQEPPAYSRPHDILQCCQEIYKVQELHSNTLCWKINGCGGQTTADKTTGGGGRSEFISHCSHHAVHLQRGSSSNSADDSIPPSSSSSSSSFQPQFTFVSAPEFSDIHWADDGHFRQLIAYSSSVKNKQVEEQWYYDVHSPLELALDPLSLLVDKDDSKNTAAAAATAATFTAKLTTTVLPDEDDDEDRRSLAQKIRIDLPPQEDSKKSSSWKVSLNIMLFLPEGIDLIRGREAAALSTCSTTSSSCTSSTRCTIIKGERVISTTSSSWMFDQQSVQYIKLEVDQLLDNDSDSGSGSCEFTWIVHVMVPDDDNILLPSPIIFNGTAVHDDDDQEETTILLFRSEHEYPMPMTMAMDDDDDWGTRSEL